MAEVNTTSGNGNSVRQRERVQVAGESIIHPLARIAAKAANRALMKACADPEKVTISEWCALSQALSTLSLAEDAGTYHYEIRMGANGEPVIAAESTTPALINF